MEKTIGRISILLRDLQILNGINAIVLLVGTLPKTEETSNILKIATDLVELLNPKNNETN